MKMQKVSFFVPSLHLNLMNAHRFKEKYHPDEARKRFLDQQSCIRWRAEVFKQLTEMEVYSAVDLDLQNETEIVKVLDSGVCMFSNLSCERASFWSQNPARVRHLGSIAKFNERVKICATAGIGGVAK